MPRKNVERELRVHVVNPDITFDPDKMRQFAKWLLHWGIKEGIITPPWERGCTDDTQKEPQDMQGLRQEIGA